MNTTFAAPPRITLLCALLAVLLAACAGSRAPTPDPNPIILPWVLSEPAYIAAAASKLSYLKAALPAAYADVMRIDAFYRTQPAMQQLSERERLAAAVHVYEVEHGLIVPTHPSQYFAQ